ncbi:PREDICTED: synaptophysin-like protein 1 isoform X1 [Amphimedon queenslandica]|uniref:MARVEL domain-containing protein n=2 Tax=Amphimedon queenslandica TaxID=400682 RepID=A0AAN0JQ32_AMPQE|nr:PREDICTED: synaptophysin-like protein 1 isoform X1 [Amphimedon queenslandica]|eukprot:XP_019858913.1 PREDICTED: synaptophysin-like protein 1 isoform X1 [Amphimedon queenslandica]
MEIHWRAPLQLKGFLKIVEMIIALLALSLVAGFTATNRAECNWWNGTKVCQITAKASYPYTIVNVTYQPSCEANATSDVLSGDYKQAAEFFVAWGSLTLFYGIIAILVYMFATANSKWEWVINYLILVDLVFHVVWVLCWFIASVEWAVVQNEMKSYIKTKVIHDKYLANSCNDTTYNEPGSYAQAAIADVFGFTSIVLWGVNIFWVVIDTSFYLQWKAKRSSSGEYNQI